MLHKNKTLSAVYPRYIFGAVWGTRRATKATQNVRYFPQEARMWLAGRLRPQVARDWPRPIMGSAVTKYVQIDELINVKYCKTIVMVIPIYSLCRLVQLYRQILKQILLQA